MFQHGACDKLQDLTSRPHYEFGRDVTCFTFIAMFVIYLPFLQSPRENPLSKKGYFFFRITNAQNVRLINHALKILERLFPQVPLHQQGGVQVYWNPLLPTSV